MDRNPSVQHRLLVALMVLGFFALGLPEALLGASWPAMGGALHGRLILVGGIAVVICMATVIAALGAVSVVRRWGVARTVACAEVLAAIGVLGFSYVDAYGSLLAFAVPYGLAAGTLTAALNGYIAPRYAARHISWFHAITAAGATAGHTMLGWLIALNFGWRWGYRSVGMALVVCAVLLAVGAPLWRHGRLLPHDSLQFERDPQHDLRLASHDGGSWRNMWRLPGFRALLALAFTYSTVQQTTMLWASSYMVHAEHMSIRGSGWLAGLFFVGLTLGLVGVGFISRHLSDFALIRMGEIVLLIALAVMIVPFPGHWRSYTAPILLGIGCAPFNPAIIHLTPQLYGTKFCGALIGSETACVYLGTLLTPAAFGLVAQYLTIHLLPWYLAVFTCLAILADQCVRRAAHRLPTGWHTARNER